MKGILGFLCFWCLVERPLSYLLSTFCVGGGGGGGVGVTFKGEFISQRPIRSCLSVMTP